MKENIILIGLMGAGKSTIGRKLAALLDMQFYDSDRVIEERTGVDIATIFEIEGEEGFRDREEQVIAELCQEENIILATGGGSILRETNRNIMKQSGYVIYLCSTAELLYSRIRYDKTRPLMQTASPLKTLKNLLNKREPYYLETAHLVMKTNRQKVAVIVKRIYQHIINRRSTVNKNSTAKRISDKQNNQISNHNPKADPS